MQDRKLAIISSSRIKNIQGWNRRSSRDFKSSEKNRNSKKSRKTSFKKSKKRGNWGSSPFLTNPPLENLSDSLSDVPMDRISIETSLQMRGLISFTIGCKITRKYKWRTIKRESSKFYILFLQLRFKMSKKSSLKKSSKAIIKSFSLKSCEELLQVLLTHLILYCMWEMIL